MDLNLVFIHNLKTQSLKAVPLRYQLCIKGVLLKGLVKIINGIPKGFDHFLQESRLFIGLTDDT